MRRAARILPWLIATPTICDAITQACRYLTARAGNHATAEQILDAIRHPAEGATP